jgi:hypothetical protein
MWVEAILTRDDLAKAMGELCPLRINIGEDGSVLLFDPRDLELVPDVGLRTTVTTEIHWPVLGIQIPVSVRSATLEVRPEIVQNPEGDTLTFRLHLDAADIAVLPAFVDRGIVDLVNAELQAKHIELAWRFGKTLSHVFDLPETLASAGALDLRAGSGRVKITREALALAVLFDARVEPRSVGPGPAAPSRAPEPAPATTRLASPGTIRPVLLRSPARFAAACGVALVATLGLLALVSRNKLPRTLWQHLRELGA